jgi:hypothetical protein
MPGAITIGLHHFNIRLTELPTGWYWELVRTSALEYENLDNGTATTFNQAIDDAKAAYERAMK